MLVKDWKNVSIFYLTGLKAFYLFKTVQNAKDFLVITLRSGSMQKKFEFYAVFF